jgi:hypothetical protein
MKARPRLSIFQYLENRLIPTEDHSWVCDRTVGVLHLMLLQDISARSPVSVYDNGRQSLDSVRIPRLPRSAMNERRFERQPPTAEEGFEDVGLNDDQTKHVKKKGFFSKFGDSDNTLSPTTSRFHLPGRKRGQSGTGEELGNMQRPGTASSTKDKEEPSQEGR